MTTHYTDPKRTNIIKKSDWNAMHIALSPTKERGQVRRDSDGVLWLWVSSGKRVEVIRYTPKTEKPEPVLLTLPGKTETDQAYGSFLLALDTAIARAKGAGLSMQDIITALHGRSDKTFREMSPQFLAGKA